VIIIPAAEHINPSTSHFRNLIRISFSPFLTELLLIESYEVRPWTSRLLTIFASKTLLESFGNTYYFAHLIVNTN